MKNKKKNFFLKYQFKFAITTKLLDPEYFLKNR